MRARRLSKDRIEIPARFDGPGGEIGDALVVIDSTDERYAVWDSYIKTLESPQVIDERA